MHYYMISYFHLKCNSLKKIIVNFLKKIFHFGTFTKSRDLIVNFFVPRHKIAKKGCNLIFFGI